VNDFPEADYWFAIRYVDEAGNQGPISNTAFATTVHG
jgi:chitodextrinase